MDVEKAPVMILTSEFLDGIASISTETGDLVSFRTVIGARFPLVAVENGIKWVSPMGIKSVAELTKDEMAQVVSARYIELAKKSPQARLSFMHRYHCEQMAYNIATGSANTQVIVDLEGQNLLEVEQLIAAGKIRFSPHKTQV